MSHVNIFVLDQNEAYDFYINKLGLEVRTDATMDNGYRWLTVGPKAQPEIEIILMPVAEGPTMDAESAEALRGLIQKGVFGLGVLDTDDCRATYAALKEKGVEFKTEPTEQFYGIEALLKDPFGNWFSMTERTHG